MKNRLERITLRTELIYRDYSISTQIIYIREVERFLDYINKEAIDIQKNDVVRYLNQEKDTKNINTILIQLNALEFFFRECLGINIADNITEFQREFKVKRLMSSHQWEEIIAKVPERERIIYLLIKELPLSLNEILSIKEDDITQIDTKFYIKNKEISLNLAREIYTYIERNSKDDYIFSLTGVKPLHKTTVQKIFVQHSQEHLNYEFSLKDFKLSVGLEIIKKYGEEEGAKYLGYEDIQSMRQYFKRIGNPYND